MIKNKWTKIKLELKRKPFYVTKRKEAQKSRKRKRRGKERKEKLIVTGFISYTRHLNRTPITSLFQWN
jgi:hypothetical protein